MDLHTSAAVLACVAVLYSITSCLARPQDCVVHNLLHVSKTPKTVLDSRLNLGIFPQVDDWNATLAFLPQHSPMSESPLCIIHLHHQVDKSVGFTDTYIRCLADGVISTKQDNLDVDRFSNETIYSTRLVQWSSEAFQKGMWTELWMQMDPESGRVELVARRANAREGFHFNLGLSGNHVHLLMHSEQDLWVYYNCHTGCPLFHEETHKLEINSYTIFLMPGPGFEALHITYRSKTDREISYTIRGIHLHNSDEHWYNITADSIAASGGLLWLHVLVDGEPVRDEVAFLQPLRLSSNLEVRLLGEGVFTFDCNPETVLSEGTSDPENRATNSSLSLHATGNSSLDVKCLLPWIISGVLLLTLVLTILSIFFCRRSQRWDLLQGRNHTENIYTNMQNSQHERNLCNAGSEVENSSTNNSPLKVCAEFGFPLKLQTDNECNEKVDSSCGKSSWENDEDEGRGRADGCSDLLDSIGAGEDEAADETCSQGNTYEDLENAYEEIPS